MSTIMQQNVKLEPAMEEMSQSTSEICALVLQLKEELGRLANDLHITQEKVCSQDVQIRIMKTERDLLLNELESKGAISTQIRERLYTVSLLDSTTLIKTRRALSELNHCTQSASRKSMSNLTDITERHSTPLKSQAQKLRSKRTSITRPNSRDSISPIPAPVTPLTSPPATPSAPLNSNNNSVIVRDAADQSKRLNTMTTPPYADISRSYPVIKSYLLNTSTKSCMSEDDDLEDVEDNEIYESDISLTETVNKSLDLGRSLVDHCANIRLDDLKDYDINESPQKSDDQAEQASIELTDFEQPPHEFNATEERRLMVVKEIIKTERTYCNSLWTILDRFCGSLKRREIVSEREISIMCPPCLLPIYNEHCRFLRSLEDRLACWQWKCILGDVFQKFTDTIGNDDEVDLLHHYQTYVQQFPAALQQISKSCANNRRFNSHLREVQDSQVCSGLDIRAFLLTPIQRFPRYILLLRQLLKETDRSHPDCYFIESSLTKLEDFLTKLNGCIKQSVDLVTMTASVPPTSTSVPKRNKRKIWLGASFRNSNTPSNDYQQDYKQSTTPAISENPSSSYLSQINSSMFHFKDNKYTTLSTSRIKRAKEIIRNTKSSSKIPDTSTRSIPVFKRSNTDTPLPTTGYIGHTLPPSDQEDNTEDTSLDSTPISCASSTLLTSSSSSASSSTASTTTTTTAINTCSSGGGGAITAGEGGAEVEVVVRRHTSSSVAAAHNAIARRRVVENRHSVSSTMSPTPVDFNQRRTGDDQDDDDVMMDSPIAMAAFHRSYSQGNLLTDADILYRSYHEPEVDAFIREQALRNYNDSIMEEDESVRSENKSHKSWRIPTKKPKMQMIEKQTSDVERTINLKKKSSIRESLKSILFKKKFLKNKNELKNCFDETMEVQEDILSSICD